VTTNAAISGIALAATFSSLFAFAALTAAGQRRSFFKLLARFFYKKYCILFLPEASIYILTP
jgi:hypothetical protein